MDEFNLDRPELTGALVSLEFGQGGRISQMWLTDPTAPEGNEDFQFVAPPVAMGDEIAEDYYPGTILLGVRTSPDDPWIVGRNTQAEYIPDEDDDGSSVRFEYEFLFIDEIRATGRFYEVTGSLPYICWEVVIKNRSRRSVEIGELGFPMALNNVLEGFPRSDEGQRNLHSERVHIHSYIGGAASYLFGQRMNGRPPGLLVFPLDDTTWEFCSHVPASLSTEMRWDGIPIVYSHSRALVDREEWPDWANGHTSIVLEPGEERTYKIGFASADRYLVDNVNSILAEFKRPSIRVYPACVVPYEVGAAIEVSGVTPARFTTDVETEMETDSDEEGGFCYVRPKQPGAVRLMIDDTSDQQSSIHLLFTEPISNLIQRRAEWIMQHQVVREPGPFQKAIVPADNRNGQAILDIEMFANGFGVISSLSDALFLAEKNTIYPVRDQVLVLDEYVDDFLEETLQNPADGSVGSVLSDPRSVATHYGRPQVYPLVMNLYRAMAHIADGYGELRHPKAHYLQRAARCALAMFRHVSRASLRATGLPLMTTLPELVQELRENKLEAEAKALEQQLVARDRELARRRYPFGVESPWSTAPFAEAFFSARRRQDEESEERLIRLAMASKSLSPSWWWYGSDKRWAISTNRAEGSVQDDRGELCLGGNTVANSLLFFEQLDRDYNQLPEGYLRAAFGGVLGVWALVRADGAASMAYCPDPSSKHFGMSWLTGDVGISLWQYLHDVAAWVLPSNQSGVSTFACHFEVDTVENVEVFRIRPWDGIGRRIVVRQLGLEAEVRHARMTELRFDARKRFATVVLENTSDKDLVASVSLRGLWGRRFEVMGRELQGVDGHVTADVAVPSNSVTKVEFRVRG